jgi:hypothetical protein
MKGSGTRHVTTLVVLTAVLALTGLLIPTVGGSDSSRARVEGLDAAAPLSAYEKIFYHERAEANHEGRLQA